MADEPPPQLHLIEQPNIDTKATNKGYSQEKNIQQYVKNLAAAWGENPDDYEAGHSPKTPQWSTPPGGSQKIGPQHRLANNKQSIQEAKDRAQAVSQGQYARTSRAHTGSPVPNPKPVQLPKDVMSIAKADRAQLIANSKKTSLSKITVEPSPSPTSKPIPPEQLPLPFDKKPPAPTPSSRTATSATNPPSRARTGGSSSLVPGGAMTGAGNAALTATRTLVPGVAEAEIGFTVASFYATSASASASAAGYTTTAAALSTTATALGTAAAYTPVVGGSLATGAVVGNLAEAGATSLGASKEVAEGTGALAATASGAAVGALIGSVVPGVGTAAGSAVGAVAGWGGYLISKYW